MTNHNPLDNDRAMAETGIPRNSGAPAPAEIKLPVNWLKEGSVGLNPSPMNRIDQERDQKRIVKILKPLNAQQAWRDEVNSISDPVLRQNIIQTAREGKTPRVSIFDLEEAMFTPASLKNGNESLDPHRKPTAAEILSMAWFESELTLEDLLPYRVHIAWRITREVARIKGFVHKETSLREATNARGSKRDPWTIPEQRSAHNQPTHANRPPSDEMVKLLQEADKVTGDDCVSYYEQENYSEVCYPGLALMPPPVPRKNLMVVPNKGIVVSDRYDPERDVMLEYFINIAKQVVDEFNIEGGSKEDPCLGRYGLAGLLNPHSIRLAWPTKQEIMCWEEMLISQTSNMLCEESTGKVRKALHDKFGLTEFEATNLVILSKQTLHEHMTNDAEVEKAVMVQRLENYIQRAKEAFDLKAEAIGYKQLAIVQGLSRIEADNEKTDIISVIKRVTEERQQRASRPVIEGTVRVIGDGT